MKFDLIIYHQYLPNIGGIESAIHNLAKGLSEAGIHILVLFDTVQDPADILKFGEVCSVGIRDRNKAYACKTMLLASNHPKPENVKYIKLLQWVHSDYQKYNIKLHDNKPDHFVSVSQHSTNVFKTLYGYDCITVQNYLDTDFNKYSKPLMLVSNTRISKEKGMHRMLKLCEMLEANKINYAYHVYGSNSASKSYENEIKALFAKHDSVTFMGLKKDIRAGLSYADYLIQLSDFEGCPYAVLEALAMGVPCVLTDFPSASELIDNGTNGYIVPFDMNFDINILNKKPTGAKLDQHGVIDSWLSLL